MSENQVMERLVQLIEHGTSPYHVTADVERQFREAGYTRLFMGRPWELERGGRYYVTVHDSSLMAFSIEGQVGRTAGFRIAAAHTDFPGLRLKQKPELLRNGYAQLNVEVYGGAILNTWLDRPLSAAGRVALRGKDVLHPVTRLVDLKSPLFVIPNLAIHLNREINKGVELNRQKELLPVAGLWGEEMKEGYFRKILAEELAVEGADILDYDIGLYNCDRPEYVDGEKQDRICRLPGSTICPECRPLCPECWKAAEKVSVWGRSLTMKRSGAGRSRERVLSF